MFKLSLLGKMRIFANYTNYFPSHFQSCLVYKVVGTKLINM